MRPEKLIISGWGPYKDRTEIDFTVFEGRGLFLVTGDTGAGKTTIFDAITYALYGSLSGEMREKTSVRSDFAEADTPTFVELFMHHAGKSYHIIRNPEYLRPRKRGTQKKTTKEKENAILYLPDGQTMEGTREVNAKMQEILVLDYAQFKQITMIAQGEFARLLLASPKEKTGIFRDIFGTGIYEQFAQSLRVRSNALYGKVIEQRHKLREDVMLLAGGRRKEIPDDLVELTEGENWNYAAVLKELENLSGQTEEEMRKQQEICNRLRDRNDELTGEVEKKKLENRQIEKLQQKERLLEELHAQKNFIEEKKEICARAKAAEALAPEQLKFRHAQKKLREAKEKLEKQWAEKERLWEEKDTLAPLTKKQEILQQYLENCRQLEENNRLLTEDKTEYEKAVGKWEKTKASYLTAEAERDRKQDAYKEADRVYRHAVVGIAARMLKPGVPCPVCGSLEHPNPAKEDALLPSEATLAGLQKEYEEAEKVLQAAQEEAIAQKSKVQELEKRCEGLRKRGEELQKKADKDSLRFVESIFTEEGFIQASYQQKAEFLQEKTRRMTRLDAQILSVSDRIRETEREMEKAKEESSNCKEALQEALSKAGFADEEACEAARITVKERQSLEWQIEDYRTRLTEAAGIKEHLEESLPGRKMHEVGMLEEEIKNCRKSLEAAQEKLKAAHAFCEEVKKTTAQFAGTYRKMEKIQAEYGYVKDLDNLASGNNAKRLVFEQYVLAGYFEEILKAANRRFLKMTGGRFEMSRVEEAGDGRVKDSLEIQVMDYYTGKPRLVKTLSGGESFKASLSLALGMSDVIQAQNGGIKVDTLFIDEGFGALDSESLDQACEALVGLAEHNRLIGIISHVPELRERMDCQIIVKKTNSGSSVKVHV